MLGPIEDPVMTIENSTLSHEHKWKLNLFREEQYVLESSQLFDQSLHDTYGLLICGGLKAKAVKILRVIVPLSHAVDVSSSDDWRGLG